MEALEAIGRCGAWSLTASNGEESVAVPMRCRRWRCPRCGPAMRNRLVHLVSQAPPDRMITLTVDTKLYADPYAAARRLSWAFPLLVKELRRHARGQPLEYLAVWERTKAGWPHLHVLVRGPYVHWAVVSNLWRDLTQSPIVDVKKLSGTRQGARYVTKYLAKDPDPFGQGRALRASRGFLVEPMRPQGKRYCTLGPLRVFEGRAWEWLADRLDHQDLVEVLDSGECHAAPWSTQEGHENAVWLRWERQRLAVERLERPPPPDRPLLAQSPWRDRPEPMPPRSRAELATAGAGGAPLPDPHGPLRGP